MEVTMIEVFRMEVTMIEVFRMEVTVIEVYSWRSTYPVEDVLWRLFLIEMKGLRRFYFIVHSIS
jgi:hypothetical protein